MLKRLFEEGEVVKSGQILYKIDDAPFNAAYEEARAQLEKAQSREQAARRQMERCIKLAKTYAVPVRERDEAIAAYREVEAEIKAAEEQLKKAAIDREYTEIKAPISGTIGRSLVQEGSLVNANQSQPLAIINQLKHVCGHSFIPL